MRARARLLLLGLASALGLAGALPARGQGASDRPIRLVVPFPPGSATDLAARVVGQQLQTLLGQPVLVDNKPGAGGSIAGAEVVRAAPDGHTLLFSSNSAVASNVALLKNIPYDPLKDFSPVAGIGETALVLMVRPAFPAARPEGIHRLRPPASRQAVGRLRLVELADQRRPAQPPGRPADAAGALQGHPARRQRRGRRLARLHLRRHRQRARAGARRHAQADRRHLRRSATRSLPTGRRWPRSCPATTSPPGSPSSARRACPRRWSSGCMRRPRRRSPCPR